VKRFIAEFKAFAVRGSVIDLAVGVIIGAAFGKITTSLVSDILMPVIGLALGGVNFAALTLTLPRFWGEGDPASLNYGAFISTVLDFVIIAFFTFLLVKAVNRLKGKPTPAPPAPAPEVKLLTEIRDLLKERGEQA
jgi:large conductance mechanosensitive channel